MNRGALLKVVESRYARTDLPEFRPGDTVRVAYRVKEGGRTRIQNFEGIVIKIKRNGYNSSFTVRKVSYGGGGGAHLPLQLPPH
jgi:large subunit ribosomal protein L19